MQIAYIIINAMNTRYLSLVEFNNYEQLYQLNLNKSRLIFLENEFKIVSRLESSARLFQSLRIFLYKYLTINDIRYVRSLRNYLQSFYKKNL